MESQSITLCSHITKTRHLETLSSNRPEGYSQLFVYGNLFFIYQNTI